MRMWIIWVVFAALMGFAIGGSVVWAIQDKHRVSHQEVAEQTSKKEETDEALAFYTLWLTAFTGVLAFATIGLGVATTGLYLTGEKQASITKAALVGDQRAWLSTKLEIGAEGMETSKIGDLGLFARLKVTNLGRTPAIDAQTNIRLVEGWTPEQVKAFASENNELGPNGLFLAPNDSYFRPWYPFLEPNDKYKRGANRAVYPMLIGCVNYRILQDDQLHQTVFVYLIGRTAEGFEWGAPFQILTDQLWKPEELTISPWSGGFAT